jgi:hypothetical protein
MFPNIHFPRGVPSALAFSALFLTAFFPASAAAQNVQHVVVIALENHGYEEVVGSPTMPYLNGLISNGALATKFYANTHPSIGNYFRLTTGETITNESGFNARVSVDNLVRRFAATGKTWKNYAESIPSAGYLGGDVNPYVKRHNPFAYFSDVIDNGAEAAKIVPLSQFSSDLSAGALPNLSFIQVNQFHNGHDCPDGGSACTNDDKLTATDQWLQANVPQILNDPGFQRDGLLVIWYDEGAETDSTNGGGHIAMVMAGPYARRGFQSNSLFRHENLGRTIFDLLGVQPPQSTFAYVTSMIEMLQSEPTSTPPPPPPPPATSNGVLTGRVTHAATGSALANVLVASSSGANFTTAADGSYNFTGLADGTYTLTASRTGYVSRTVSATVTGGSGTLDFTLATGGKIAGTVKNSSGAALANARVEISGGPYGATYTLTTSSTGYYNSNWIPAGTYTLSVSATGYATKSQSAVAPTGTTGTVNVVM